MISTRATPSGHEINEEDITRSRRLRLSITRGLRGLLELVRFL